MPGSPARKAARAARSLRRNDQGVAAVELALLSPVILVLLAFLFDFGMGMLNHMQLSSAARAGAQYALLVAPDTTGVQQAVDGAAGLKDPPLNITVEQFCECTDGTTITCGTTCSNNITYMLFVRVTATQSYSPMFPMPGLPETMTLTGKATVRIQ
ncbi:MAG: TadE/TadG family type IV pilus assembly protein [Alphaproteobacteria bacterium]